MAKKQPAAAVAVDDDDDDVVEELEETKPAKAAAPEEFGVRNGLIPLLKAKTGKDYSPREVRTLLRKLARDGAGVDREIIAGNKSRYVWSGPEDPEVRTIIKAVKGGAIEESKKAALDKLKSDKAAKTAAKQAADEKAAKKAAKAAAVVDDDDED